MNLFVGKAFGIELVFYFTHGKKASKNKNKA